MNKFETLVHSMNQFIPLNTYLQYFGLSGEQDLLNQLDQLADKMRTGVLDLSTFPVPNITKEALLSQLQDLKQESVLVFHQWTEQSKNLSKLLESGQLNICDFHAQIGKEHFLFGPFSQWLAPFLSQALLRHCHELNTSKASIVASYLLLLPENDRLLIEQRIQAFFEKEWLAAKAQILDRMPEKAFIQLIAPSFGDARMICLNAFSKAMYHPKLELIEEAITLMKHPSCTYRAAWWLVNQLKKLNLNPEHENQLKELHQSLRDGDGRFRPKESLLSRERYSRGALLRSLGLLLAISLLGYLFYFILTYQQNDQVEVRSAFESFTPQERRHMDSLIRSMEPATQDERNHYVDKGNLGLHLTPVDEPTVDRIDLQNTRVNTYISDCIKALDAQERGELEYANPYSKKDIQRVQIHNFSGLGEHQGKSTLCIQNSSDDQLLIILFDDEAGKGAYAGVINVAEDARFMVNENQRLFVLPGNKLAPFKARTGAQNLPGAAYHHHFYDNDMTLRHRLLWPYQFKSKLVPEGKVMVSRDEAGQLVLVDLQKMLEKQ